MKDECASCGSTENLQLHHLSYNPEVKVLLCVECHKKVHKHGVGKGKKRKQEKKVGIYVPQVDLVFNFGDECYRITYPQKDTTGKTYWRTPSSKEHLSLASEICTSANLDKPIYGYPIFAPYINVTIKEKDKIVPPGEDEIKVDKTKVKVLLPTGKKSLADAIAEPASKKVLDMFK